MSAPFFSIIVPTYNRAALVSQTVRSMLGQTFPELEVIVVDDGGTDDTEQVLRSLGDARIRYFRKENGERGAARNFGLARATGTYVCFFDSDDYMLPGHLENMHSFLEKEGFPKLVFTSYSTEQNGVIVKNHITAAQMETGQLCYNNVFAPLACFIQNEQLEKELFSNDRQFVFIEELYAWLKLLKNATPVFYDANGAVLVAHDENSMNAPDPGKFAYSLEKIITLVRREKLLTPRQLKLLHSSQLTMYALILAQHKKRGRALAQLAKAFFTDFRMLKLKRTYAVVYKSIKCW